MPFFGARYWITMSSASYYEIKRAVHSLMEEIKLVGPANFKASYYFDALRAFITMLPKEWDSHVQRLYQLNDHPEIEEIVEATSRDVAEAPNADAEGCFMMIQRLALTIRVTQLLRDSPPKP
jgi:hypothetical protein